MDEDKYIPKIVRNPDGTRTVTLMYLTPEKKEAEGNFILRRLNVDRFTTALMAKQERNPRTGDFLPVHSAIATKYWVAMSIDACPLVWDSKPWADLSTEDRVAAVGRDMEPDMYGVIVVESNKFMRTTVQELNLFGAVSAPSATAAPPGV